MVRFQPFSKVPTIFWLRGFSRLKIKEMPSVEILHYPSVRTGASNLSVWTNGPESLSRVSPETGVGPSAALSRKQPGRAEGAERVRVVIFVFPYNPAPIPIPTSPLV